MIYYIRFDVFYHPVSERSYNYDFEVFTLIRYNNPLRYEYYYNGEWHELS